MWIILSVFNIYISFVCGWCVYRREDLCYGRFLGLNKVSYYFFVFLKVFMGDGCIVY